MSNALLFGRCVYRAIPVSLLIVLAAQPVRAQTVNYATLQQLFGEAVTTSATGTPQRVTDVAVNMEIISADEIRRSGAHDIAGVLRQVVGVDILQWNNNNADIGIRGYNQVFSPRVLVLVDGRQVYADHYGYTPWSVVPVELNAIRQIEVIKGPNAAIYGFNAVSGVINIITYSPLYDDVDTVTLRGGTQSLAAASAVQTIKFGDWGGVRLTASARTDKDFSTSIPASAGSLLRADNDVYSASAVGLFQLSDSVQAGFELSHGDGSTNDLNPVYALVHDRHRMSSVKGMVAADTSFGLIQANIYRNWSQQKYPGAQGARTTFNNEVTVAQVQDVFRIGAAHVFRLTAEYRHNAVNTTPTAGANVFYDDYAVGGMWNWSVSPALSLTSALRWENLVLGRSGSVPPNYPFTNADWDRVIAAISYTNGLVWEASDADTFRVTVSKGARIPSLANFGAWLFTSPFANSTGGPHINPTPVINYEIGWDRALPAISGLFRAAAFYQEAEDVVSIQGTRSSTTPPFSLQSNIGDSYARGIELSVKGIYGEGWRWGVSYRYETITDVFIPAAQNGTAYSDFQNVTPKHMVKANVGWARGKWEADAYLYYESDTRGLASLPFSSGAFLTPVPAYVAVDARLAYDLNDWLVVAVSGQNLAQSPQQQTSGPEVERRVFATLTASY